MNRRRFCKVIGTMSAGLAGGSCVDNRSENLPLLVSEEEIVLGEQVWRPSVCRECDAGCGTMIRLMEAERKIERDGNWYRQPIAAVKKIEGNPLDPVSAGGLCARGQAAVQSVYHPDRLRTPQARTGARGEGQFDALSWDEALTEAARLLEEQVSKDPSRILFLGRHSAGNRAAAVQTFLGALGAPSAATIGFSDFTVELKAAQAAFGFAALPFHDIQGADYVLGIGADFLGGWISPVLYARNFGRMRQGRPGRRGRLCQAESRHSLTASSADRWLPLTPGGEHALALAIGHALVEDGLLGRPDASPQGLQECFAAVDFDLAAKSSGVPPELIREVARELGTSDAPLVVAGASIVQANSVAAVTAGNALNLLLDNVGRSGGVMPPPDTSSDLYSRSRPQYRSVMEGLERAELVILDGVNPVFAVPSTEPLIAKAPSVISFSSFLDDSSAFADLILPACAGVESSEVVTPPVSPASGLTGGNALVRPLFENRRVPDILMALAEKLGHPFTVDSPQSAFHAVYAGSQHARNQPVDEAVDSLIRQGGWWIESPERVTVKKASAVPPHSEPEFQGDPKEFPYHFQPYPSVQFGDGNSAHLPWMQELPDPVSSTMWGLPVEVDPKTAAQLGVVNGDFVRVVSPTGSIEAQVYVHPAAVPGVVSMAIGQGHTHFGRYASGRGVNPLTIVAAAWERESGVLAFGATRVRLEHTDRSGQLVQFSMMDREPEFQRR